MNLVKEMTNDYLLYVWLEKERLKKGMSRTRASFIVRGGFIHIYYAEISHYDVSKPAYFIHRWVGNRCTTLVCKSEQDLFVEMAKIAPLHHWNCSVIW